MNPKWEKLGLLYNPLENDRHLKLLSHAANPLPVLMEEDTYRIFFCGRDAKNRSSVGAVDIDIVKQKIIQEHRVPFFIHGPKGSFYEDGISLGNCYEVNRVKYMLFMGWQSPTNRHWRGEIGRFVVTPNLTLELENTMPFMGIDETDPISLSYPWVTKTILGKYCMWYGSTKSWDAGNKEMLHVINYAESTDGHKWVRKGLALPFKIGKIQAFSRPTVIFNINGNYEMWFSYRAGNGGKYRIGYATGQDIHKWKLKLSNTNINISSNGWDSEMIEYPFVFNHKGQRYMLYNGNGYGKTGFGLAVLKYINNTL